METIKTRKHMLTFGNLEVGEKLSNMKKLTAEEKAAFRSIIQQIDLGRVENEEDLDALKKDAVVKFKLKKIPTNADILTLVPQNQRKKYEAFLKTKPTRTVSGTTIIAVAAYPFPCIKNCTFCPAVKGQPRSYTGTEPAIQRANRAEWDPYLQIKTRLEQLQLTNHPTDKVEVIVIGGTFLALDEKYQMNFVKGIYDGLNYDVVNNGTVDVAKRINALDTKMPTEQLAKQLELAKTTNETAKHRAVSFTIETRPDWCFEKDINRMLEFGTTRVELGVQVLDDEIYKKVDRGHTVADVAKATKFLRSNCFKFLYHWMPGLWSAPKHDLEMFKQLWTDERFRPDMLKIYPTLVVPNTRLYTQYLNGEFEPLGTEDAVPIIAKMKKEVPKYCRIQRVQRDFDSRNIQGGVTVSNFRQLVQEYMKKKKWKCSCIRCREVGHKILSDGIIVSSDKIKLHTHEYNAAQGKEIFISFDDVKNDAIIGFTRLRINGNDLSHVVRKEITPKSALIRELRVYGQQLPLGKHYKGDDSWQHKNYGQLLIQEAEKIASEKFGMKEMIINSGVGVKQYFRQKLGYDYKGPYMEKKLN